MKVSEFIATSAVVKALREVSALPGPLAVEILGRRPGTVYLRAGRITCIDTSGTPDLRTRLERSGAVRNGGGLAALRDPGSLPDAIRRLVSGGELSSADAESIAESVIIDAVQSLLEQSEPAVPQLRIHPGAVPANGSDHHFGVETVIRAACERIARCAVLGIDPDVSVDLRPVTRPVLSLDERQWAVVTKIDGRRTPRDLAWVTGAEVFATVEQVSGLVAAGLVRVVRLQRRSGGTAIQRTPGLRGAVMLDTVVTDGVATDGVATDGVATDAGAPRPMRRPDEPRPIVHQRRSGPPSDDLLSVAIAPPAEWAADLTAEVTVDPDLITRLITGLRAME